MFFLNPGILWGLFAVFIPLIIHLFNFRKYKKVYFTNVRFLKNLKQQSRKQSRIRNVIVLLLRMMAIGLFVLAFARPVFRANQNGQHQYSRSYISIYLDNSFSMQSVARGGSLFEDARKFAQEIASSYNESTEFLLITNDFAPGYQRLLSREAFFNELDDIQLSPVFTPINEIVEQQYALLNDAGQGEKHIYLLSDFQKSDFNNSELQQDTAISVFMLPLPGPDIPNLAIDSCWFDAPVHFLNQQAKLWVRIKNYSSASFERLPAQLNFNGIRKGVAVFDIKAFSSTDISFSFLETEPGIRFGKIQIKDHPIVFDDDFFLSYYIDPEIQITSVCEEKASNYLEAVFAHDSAFNYKAMKLKDLDYELLAQSDVLILDGLNDIPSGLGNTIRSLLNNGSSLVFIPGTELNLSESAISFFDKGLSYQDTLRIDMPLGSVNYEHPLFDGVFDNIPENIKMPFVKKMYSVSYSRQAGLQSVMSLKNGLPFVLEYKKAKGRVFLFAAPLNTNWNSFPRHSLFLPLMYRIALTSNVSHNLYYTLGETDYIALPPGVNSTEKIAVIKNINTDEEFIPPLRKDQNTLSMNIREDIFDASNYEVLFEGQILGGFACNYDRRESDPLRLSDKELQAFDDLEMFDVIPVGDKPDFNMGYYVSDIIKQDYLWKYFLLFGLLCLFAEIVVLRFF